MHHGISRHQDYIFLLNMEAFSVTLIIDHTRLLDMSLHVLTWTYHELPFSGFPMFTNIDAFVHSPGKSLSDFNILRLNVTGAT